MSTGRWAGVLDRLDEELRRAYTKFPDMASPHEGYAVLLEELDELWDEVKANRGRSPEAMAEALQVAAMAVRYIVDLEGSDAPVRVAA